MTSGAGEGAFSLIGLTSSGRGRVGEHRSLLEMDFEELFHLVAEKDVLIRGGRDGFLFTVVAMLEGVRVIDLEEWGCGVVMTGGDR